MELDRRNCKLQSPSTTNPNYLFARENLLKLRALQALIFITKYITFGIVNLPFVLLFCHPGMTTSEKNIRVLFGLPINMIWAFLVTHYAFPINICLERKYDPEYPDEEALAFLEEQVEMLVEDSQAHGMWESRPRQVAFIEERFDTLGKDLEACFSLQKKVEEKSTIEGGEKDLFELHGYVTRFSRILGGRANSLVFTAGIISQLPYDGERHADICDEFVELERAFKRFESWGWISEDSGFGSRLNKGDLYLDGEPSEGKRLYDRVFIMFG